MTTDELDRLKADAERWRVRAIERRDFAFQIVQKLKAMRADRGRFEAAAEVMRSYVTHQTGCRAIGPDRCTCGLDDAIALLEKAREGRNE